MFKYSISLAWCNEDYSYIATIQEFPGLSAFGETPEEAVKEAKVAAKGFIQVFKEDGKEIPEPIPKKQFSGQTRLRLPKGLHQNLAIEADKEGVSLNTYLVSLLSEQFNSKKIERKLECIEKIVTEQRAAQIKTESEPTIIIRKDNWEDGNDNISIH